MDRTQLRINAARFTWYGFLFVYAAAFVFGLQGSLVTPLLAAGPLLIAAGLFALLIGSSAPRFVIYVIVAAMLESVLAMLLLGGPERTWMIRGRTWSSPPGVPRVLVIPVWIIAMLLPLGITFVALRRVKRLAPRR